jgi:hypothetical protein
MKIRQMEAEFYTYRWTDMTKLIVAICNFAIAPKNQGDINKSAKFSGRLRSLLLSKS